MGRSATKTFTVNDVVGLFNKLSEKDRNEAFRSIVALRNIQAQNKRMQVKNTLGRGTEARGTRVSYTDPRTGMTASGIVKKMKRKYAEVQVNDKLWNVPITWLKES